MGCGAVWMRLCCAVSTGSAPKPRHLHVSVQRESTVVSAAGQEVQPQHLQVGAQDVHALAKERESKTVTLSFFFHILVVLFYHMLHLTMSLYKFNLVRLYVNTQYLFFYLIF